MGCLLCLWHFPRTLQVLAHLNPIRTSWSKDCYDLVCTWHNSGTDDFGNEFMITQLVVGSRDGNSERLTVEHNSESFTHLCLRVLIHPLCSRPWRWEEGAKQA